MLKLYILIQIWNSCELFAGLGIPSCSYVNFRSDSTLQGRNISPQHDLPSHCLAGSTNNWVFDSHFLYNTQNSACHRMRVFDGLNFYWVIFEHLLWRIISLKIKSLKFFYWVKFGEHYSGFWDNAFRTYTMYNIKMGEYTRKK